MIAIKKGMGSVRAFKNVFPNNEAQMRHIFRDKGGHIENVCNTEENYLGKDKYGNEWYSKTQTDGSQIWVTTGNGIIQNGGLNNPPRKWNNQTGFSRAKGV